MAETIIAQNTMTVEMIITWDGQYYFYDRYRPRSGKPPQQISAERASEIICLNESEPGVKISTQGKVEIGSVHAWSWIAKVQVPINEGPA